LAVLLRNRLADEFLSGPQAGAGKVVKLFAGDADKGPLLRKEPALAGKKADIVEVIPVLAFLHALQSAQVVRPAFVEASARKIIPVLAVAEHQDLRFRPVRAVAAVAEVLALHARLAGRDGKEEGQQDARGTFAARGKKCCPAGQGGVFLCVHLAVLSVVWLLRWACFFGFLPMGAGLSRIGAGLQLSVVKDASANL
jgi:hypothetical protein